MSEAHQLEGIVLQTWPYGDKDLIVSLMTPSKGKIRGIAKGARASQKRFAGTLDLCSHARFLIREKKNNSLVFIEQASLISGFLQLRQDYSTLMMAMGLLEMTDFFSHEHHLDQGTFHILEKALVNLEKVGASPEFFWGTALAYLKEMGLFPALNLCSECREKIEMGSSYFMNQEARFVCGNCLNDQRQHFIIPEGFKDWMRKAGEQEDSAYELSAKEKQALQKILELHLSHHFHSVPDWSRFLG